MNNSTQLTETYNDQTRIDEWNSEYVRALLSDTIILIIYMVIGVIGNITVMCVYALRFKKKSEDRFFIPYLAVIDLIAGTVCSSFGIWVNQHAVNFTSDIVCKLFWMLSLLTTGCSIFTLLLISIQRYQKICRPFHPQMSLRRKKLGLLCCVAASLLLSFPAIIFYGTSPVTNPENGIVGTRCANIRGPWSKTVAIAYKGVILLTCMCVLIALMVFYSLIGRSIYKQIRFNKNRQQQQIAVAVIASECNTLSSDSTSNLTSSASGGVDNRRIIPQTKVTPATAPRKKHIPGYRLSMMFMLITFVFILCFIPKMAMMVFESRNELFWLTLDSSGYGGYRFLYTMYIINSFANPIIYGFFDRQFRQEFMSLFRKQTIYKF